MILLNKENNEQTKLNCKIEKKIYIDYENRKKKMKKNYFNKIVVWEDV